MPTNRIIPEELATPTTLDRSGAQQVINALNPLIADSFALYVKTKSFHWHLTGPHFRDYHLLFDEQADQIFATIDVLAERVRKLGGTTIHSISHIHQLQSIQDENSAYHPDQEMIQKLLNDNQSVAKSIKHAHKICEEQEDIATASLLEVFLDETERRIWFLFETQE